MVARSKARFLAEDIWDTPDDGNRYEVIDGELYVSPPPVREHQHFSFELGYRIRHYLEEHPIGVAYAAPFWRGPDRIERSPAGSGLCLE
jgi:Uma2 family endonuclease